MGRNATGRTIAIGDVHGCIDEFRELLKLVSYRPGVDTVVQVGDLLDRGPDPVGCVRFAREQRFQVVRGNHECKHIRWRKHEATRGIKRNPVGLTEVRVQQNLALSEDDIRWLNALPLMIDLGGGLVAVHAGLEPAFSLALQSAAVCRVRYVDEAGVMLSYSAQAKRPQGSAYWATRWRGPESVVYGHAVHSLDEPRIDRFAGGACYGLDTGVVFGGRLSALIVASGSDVEFAQVQAKAVYYHGFKPQD